MLARGRTDNGESLTELLVSIALMGVLVTALMGAVFVTIASSKMLKDEVAPENNVGLIIANWADAIDLTAYASCATAASVAHGSYPGSDAAGTMWTWDAANGRWTKGSGAALFTATVTEVTYWDIGTDVVDPGFVATCPGNPDDGAQQLLLTVTGPPSSTSGTTQSVRIVKRNPCTTAEVAAKAAGCV
ncbi:MAG: hypothetical protein WCP28_01080 [Actinomycetes bacterium]